MGEACFILHLVCILTLSIYTAGFRPNPLPSFINRLMKQSCPCAADAAEVKRVQVIHRSGWESAAVWHCLDLAARFKQKTTNLPDQKPLKPAPVNQLSPDWLGEWLHTGQYPVSPLTRHSAHLKKINTNVSVFKTKLMILSFNPKGTGFTGLLQTPLHSCTCALMESKEWRLASMLVIHNLQIATARLESWKSSAHAADSRLFTSFCFQIHFSLIPSLFLFRLTLH